MRQRGERRDILRWLIHAEREKTDVLRHGQPGHIEPARTAKLQIFELRQVQDFLQPRLGARPAVVLDRLQMGKLVQDLVEILAGWREHPGSSRWRGLLLAWRPQARQHDSFDIFLPSRRADSLQILRKLNPLDERLGPRRIGNLRIACVMRDGPVHPTKEDCDDQQRPQKRARRVRHRDPSQSGH